MIQDVSGLFEGGTPQENYVLKQVEAGEVADLKLQFGEKEEDRLLSARFLEDPRRLLKGESTG